MFDCQILAHKKQNSSTQTHLSNKTLTIGFYVQKSAQMTQESLVLLKSFASTESVSVEHYANGGRCYAIPVLCMLFSDEPYTSEDMFDMANICLDCSYMMPLGVPYMQCKITYEKDNKVALLEEVAIPLNRKKQNAYQRKIVALLNQCSKRIIEQEMKKNKIARAAVANSTLRNNMYN